MIRRLSRAAVKIKPAIAIPIVTGIASSLYAFAHQMRVGILGESQAFCNINDFFSCDRAAASRYSHFMGVPQSVWGLIFFIFLIHSLWKTKKSGLPRNGYIWFTRGLLIVGTLYVLCLFFITVAILHALCLSCLFVHLSVYVATIMYWRTWRPDQTLGDLLQLRHFWRIVLANLSVLLLSIIVIGQSRQSIYLFASKYYNRSVQRNMTKSTLGPKTRPQVHVAPFNAIVGPHDAPHTLVKFVDYTCPQCAIFKTLVDNIMRDFPNRIRLVHKHFPLERICNHTLARSPHVSACQAAWAAQCYIDAGEFEAFRSVIWRQNSYEPEDLLMNIPTHKFSKESLAACMQSNETRKKIEEDVNYGARWGANRTPFVVIDGEVIENVTIEEVLKRIL